MFRRGWYIIEEVCAKEGIRVEDLQNRRRTKTLARIRADVVKRLREETDLSWAEIAGMVGRKASFRGVRRFRAGSY